MRKKNYKIHNEKADFRALGEKYNIDPVLAKILVNKGIKEDSFERFLNPNLTNLHDPFLFENMEAVVNMIFNHIDNNSQIVIVSDYDVDGVCSGFILADYIKRVGGNVVNIIPDRMIDGYGINRNHVDTVASINTKLIITTDNGIAASDAITYAKEKGINVIVTDHHEVPRDIDENGEITYVYPPADLIIDPKIPDCKYPFKDLCGGGVAFKLVCAMAKDRPVDPVIKSEYLQIAALATVCDIVSLTDENRDLVYYGIKYMKNTTNIGLKALIEEAKIKTEHMSTYHFSFIIGPCINSSGRLETALRPLELLGCSDYDEAKKIASELVALNNSRKSLMEDSINKAIEMVKDDERDILIIYLPDCHESLAGLVASRVKDRYYKPTIVFAGDNNEGLIKGSARSIESYNIYNGLNECKKYMVKFGGHSMAAGLTIKFDELNDFRDDINNKSPLSKEDLIETIYLDCKMPIEYATEKLVNDLELLEPFGKDNSRPVFGYSKVKVKKIQVFGANSNVLRFNLWSKSGKIIDAVMFTDALGEIKRLREKHGDYDIDNALEGRENNLTINFTYYPTINEYMGNKKIQLNITSLII